RGDRAPALNAPTLSRGNGDGDVFHTIRTGVPGTQMPPFARLTDTEIWQLTSYIRSLQGMAPAGDAATEGNPAAGEALFFDAGGRAGCAACHEVNGRGGIVGPDLSSAGRQTAATLRQKIVNPAGEGGTATPGTVIVKARDGREIRGVRRNEDTFSLQMV